MALVREGVKRRRELRRSETRRIKTFSGGISVAARNGKPIALTVIQSSLIWPVPGNRHVAFASPWRQPKRIWSGNLIHPPGLGTEGEGSRPFDMALGGSGVWMYVPILGDVVGWCLVWGGG